MLVLSRKMGETVLIDPRTCPVNDQGMIAVTVVRLGGDSVRLGFEAPARVVIYREELHRDDTQLEEAGA